MMHWTHTLAETAAVPFHFPLRQLDRAPSTARPSPRALWFGLVALMLSPSLSATAQDDVVPLPLEPPSRPFLLVDAERRFLPTENAEVRIQLRDGGRARLTVYRLRGSDDAFQLGGARQGVALASSTLGAEAERLLLAPGSLPVEGERLVLLRDTPLPMPRPNRARHVLNETQVYDSNEEEESDVSTYWVRTGNWSVRRMNLGKLDAGTYLVRVIAGPYASTALLSVGETVMLVRRGDVEDLVFVTNAQGQPVGNQRVEAIDEEVVGFAVTNERGIARFPARNSLALRYRLTRGSEALYSDVVHARLDPCDPRVYLATGRPRYRRGERVYLRGQVRGCDADGNYVGLANEPVIVAHGDAQTEATSDQDGNFIAELIADAPGEPLIARHRGRASERRVQYDNRRLPRQSVVVVTDRPWATAGTTVQVRVSDENGGWPTRSDVSLEVGERWFHGEVGPGQPAVFHIPIPAHLREVRHWDLVARVSHGSVTVGRASLFVGPSQDIVEVSADERGQPGTDHRLDVRLSDLGGNPHAGELQISTWSADGAGRRRRKLSEHTSRVGPSGQASVAARLSGAGPWVLRAELSSGDGHEVVVWSRRRPPALSPRGPLAVFPASSRALPGQPVDVQVRVPRGPGSVFLTYEQGSVLHVEHLRGAGLRQVRFPAPSTGRGLGKLVATHISRGRVRTASATLQIATAREVTMSAETNKSHYDGGEIAKLRLEARDETGQPARGVVSLWVADAGYWDLGDDDYPLPGPYLSRTGRPASSGDSTAPQGYGAEEGRFLPDARMVWNGDSLPRSSFRHAWGHFGRVLRLQAQGELPAVVGAVATAVGLEGAEVCPELVEEHGVVDLRVTDLPWDMVVHRIAEQVDTYAQREGNKIHLPCPGGIGLGNGSGFGRGGGRAPAIRSGAATSTREERLLGTLRFIGLRRLNDDGSLEYDLELPAEPGRFRLEALLITDDGGGDRAHAVVRTQKPLTVWTNLPAALRPGDEGRGSLEIVSAVDQVVQLDVELPPLLELARPLPSTVAVTRGSTIVPIPLRAREPGEGAYRVSVTGGTYSDAVSTPFQVLRPEAMQHFRVGSLVGPEATVVDIPLPRLSEEGLLRVQPSVGVADAIRTAFEEVRAPRWQISAMRLDRVATLDGLITAAETLPRRERGTLVEDLRHAHRAEIADLHRMATRHGVRWWRGLAANMQLTAEALSLGLYDRAHPQALYRLLDAEAHNRFSGTQAALTALAFARVDANREVGDLRPRVLRLLDVVMQEGEPPLDALTYALRAAREVRAVHRARRLSLRVEARLQELIQRAEAPTSCGGPVWFLCYRRWGGRGVAARAAVALLEGGPTYRQSAVDTARWLAQRGPTASGFQWGREAGAELALLARLRPTRPSPVRARIDGSLVPLQGGTVRIPVGAARLQLEFSAREGRLQRVEVDGQVQIEAPDRRLGPTRFTRHFRPTPGGLELELETELDHGSAMTLTVPLPAGAMINDSNEVSGCMLSHLSGALELRCPADGPRRRQLRIGLSRISSGEFEAGSATLVSEHPDEWAILPPTRVVVR
ncbi:MAG: hypothetical protein AAGF12_20470 [Myxococcota bacterium]